MKLFLLKKYYSAIRRVWPISLPLFMLGVGLSVYFSQTETTLAWVGAFSVIYFGAWFILTLYLSHNKIFFSIPILLKYGTVAPANLLDSWSKDGQDASAFSVHKVLFRRPDNSVGEIRFYETRVNKKPQFTKLAWTYPQELFVDYPHVGEEFEIIYLDGYEKYMMILNTGRSPFAKRVQAGNHQGHIEKLEKIVLQAEISLNLDPTNHEKQKKLQEAKRALIDYEDWATAP